MKILYSIISTLFFIAASPLLSGLITKLKNNIRMRRGQSIFQPYYNLAKLFYKDEVVSETASWIFRSAPFVVIASALAAALFVPVFIVAAPGRAMGDFLALIFIFALGRFFLALSALDTGSSFGGMGASREMFISSLAEPVAILSVFAVSLRAGSTDISVLGGAHSVLISSVVAAIALLLVAMAETSRVPVDNQETHLELTMAHEAMVLEYSGRSLAIIEMASYIKQMVWFFLIAQVVFSGFAAISAVIVIAIAVALVEVSVAKMRLFRVMDFLGFAFVLGIVAIICAILGV